MDQAKAGARKHKSTGHSLHQLDIHSMCFFCLSLICSPPSSFLCGLHPLSSTMYVMFAQPAVHPPQYQVPFLARGEHFLHRLDWRHHLLARLG